MTTIDDYMHNPHWRAMFERAIRPVNNGYYNNARWVQGSAGMHHPMFITSNEYAYTSMKHGQENIVPYRAGIKNFSPSVTPQLQRQVANCNKNTLNPSGCELAAIRKVYVKDSLPSFGSHEHPQVPRHMPDNTPHPYGLSYKTGNMQNGHHIPPNYHVYN